MPAIEPAAGKDPVWPADIYPTSESGVMPVMAEAASMLRKTKG
jgi:hypothetical protein